MQSPQSVLEHSRGEACDINTTSYGSRVSTGPRFCCITHSALDTINLVI